jgi:uncharacterized protein involved in exopolysaccharide biosynthesis
VERRLQEVRDSLRAAEDRLQAFLSQNRDFGKSPTLTFTQARLERAVEFQQQLLATLIPAYEQSKIEEVRDTPVLTILRQAEAPIRPNPRGRLRLMVLGLLGGIAVGVALALGTEAMGRLRSSSEPAAEEFATLAAQLKAQVRKRGLLRALFESNPV